MIEDCSCCDHTLNDHLDEAGELTSCWRCDQERERAREEAWGPSRLRRWAHHVFDWHIWTARSGVSQCAHCGKRHP